MDYSELFPYFQDYYTLSFKENTLFSWHYHEEFECIKVTESSIKVRANLKEIILKEGDVCLIQSNAFHKVELNDCKSSSFYTISFRPEFIYGKKMSLIYLKLLKPLLESEIFSVELLDENEKNYISQCFSNYEKKEKGYELKIRNLISSLLLTFIEENEKLDSMQTGGWMKDVQKVKDMVSFMEKHYKSILTIDEIAKEGSMHKRECFRCFQRVLGISPIQYLLNYRLMIASNLLKATTFSVAQISLEVGMKSPSYFTKMFKEKMHCTPIQYRKAQEKV